MSLQNVPKDDIINPHDSDVDGLAKMPSFVSTEFSIAPSPHRDGKDETAPFELPSSEGNGKLSVGLSI